jgi:BTB/POZ domain
MNPGKYNPLVSATKRLTCDTASGNAWTPTPGQTQTLETDGSRTIIDIGDVDFVTVYNILYYLYTKRVNLHLDDGKVHTHPAGYPDKVDAFKLYQAANEYLLDNLQDRCSRVLISTCTVDNICSRLFDVKCKPFDHLKNEYMDYLVLHYDKIKRSPDWEKSILKLQRCGFDELRYRSRVLFEITRRFTAHDFDVEYEYEE